MSEFDSHGVTHSYDLVPHLSKLLSKLQLQAIHNTFIVSWSGSSVLQNWVDDLLVSLYKGKSEKSICNHYCGITLLEAVGKIFVRLLLNSQLEDICLVVILVVQGGFRSGKGTIWKVIWVDTIEEKGLIQMMQEIHEMVIIFEYEQLLYINNMAKS